MPTIKWLNTGKMDEDEKASGAAEDNDGMMALQGCRGKGEASLEQSWH